MTIILAGGTGFLGRALAARLHASGHTVRILTRKATASTPETVEWQPDGTVGTWARVLRGAAAIVNLSGAGIADARWTPSRKATLRNSRVRATRSLVLALEQTPQPPVLVNASAVGFYGDCGDSIVTESSPAGGDFLAQLCVAWETEAERAAHATRVTILRSGLVMDPSGGALARMLLPFKLGLGGRLGSGTQYLPWIHVEDWLDLVMHLIATPEARGPFNVTAPSPATNADFTRALGRALGRPTFMRVPAFGLRVALGELADTLLTGQRALPKRAEEIGFTFRFREIDTALRSLLR